MEYNYQSARPGLQELLSSISLDISYHKGEGNYLFYNENGQEKKVLDFIGGYGSLILGHNYPSLKEYSKNLLDNDVPTHSQLSIKHYGGLLTSYISDELNSYSGKEYITTLCNTGTEAVEASIKHIQLIYKKKVQSILDQAHRALNEINNKYYFINKNSHFNMDGLEISGYENLRAHILEINEAELDRFQPFIATPNKAFHGKTTGSLKLTHNRKFKELFELKAGKETRHFDFNRNSIDSLFTDTFTFSIPQLQPTGEIKLIKTKLPLCMGIVAEPILGEGGVHAVPAEMLGYLREVTEHFTIPLVFDEIQCGMYRTGSFTYSSTQEVFPDIYLLGKSMGGGLCKISACVISKDQYQDEFGIVHTSTFGEDEISSAISLKALEITKALSPKIPEIRNILTEKLYELRNQFPEVISDVRSYGLMTGLTFENLDISNSYSFQMASRSGYFGYLVASYLFHKHQIRVAPTLSDGFTIRIQPSILTQTSEIEHLAEALKDVTRVIFCRDFYKLIEHTLPADYQNLRPLKDYGRDEIPFENDEDLTTIGFITHLVNEKCARGCDESLQLLPDDVLNEALQKVIPISVPIVCGSKIITSGNGEKVNAVFSALLFTAAMARQVMVENTAEKLEYERLCQEAVDLLKTDHKAFVVGLGQYSSVVTLNGKTLTSSDVRVTSGNSFTVAIGINSLYSELQSRIKSKRPVAFGVIGAGGNISSVYIKCFSPYCSKIYLKGSDSAKSDLKMERLGREILSHLFGIILQKKGKNLHPDMHETLVYTGVYARIKNGELSLNSFNLYSELKTELGEDTPIQIIKTLPELKVCNVVMAATNHPEPFLVSEYFSPGTIVYDISVPVNCTEELLNNNKDIKVILGGVVQLPHAEKLPLKWYPLEEGEAFACISETMLLGIEKLDVNFSFGNLINSQIGEISEIGNKHGFHYKKPKLEVIF